MTSGRPPGPLIVVVDDVADNREVYGQILAFKGYRVLNAANGTEGLGLAASAQAAGVDHYLVKPCLPDDLVAAVRRLLGAQAV